MAGAETVAVATVAADAAAEDAVEAATELLARANEFDLAPVRARFCRTYAVSDGTARRYERELKRYLVLCALAEGPLKMEGPVDEFWHTFLLFTRTYSAFCDRVAGRFLHHEPAGGARPLGTLSETFTRYRSAFGEDPPADLWTA